MTEKKSRMIGYCCEKGGAESDKNKIIVEGQGKFGRFFRKNRLYFLGRDGVLLGGKSISATGRETEVLWDGRKE